MSRDSQQTKIFECERKAIAAVGPVDDMVYLQERSDDIFNSRLWRSRMRDQEIDMARPIHVSRAHSGGTCGLGTVRLDLSPSRRHSLAVCHAYAHWMAAPGEANHPMAGWDLAPHGPLFVQAWIKLVKRFCDPKETKWLLDLFREQKVKTRLMSKESRDAARSRWYERREAELPGNLQSLATRLAAMKGES